MTKVGATKERSTTRRIGDFKLFSLAPAVAWLVSHAIGVLGLAVWPNRSGQWFNTFGLTYMDGGWYRLIITSGYPSGPLPDYGTTWPFFPLFPWLADLPTRIGAPVGPSLVAVSWIFSLAAMYGVWFLALGHFDRKVATASVWVFALLPGAVGQVLAYSDGAFAAGLAWTLVALGHVDRDGTNATVNPKWVALAASATLVTVASRPNGALIIPVIVHAVWRSPRTRARLPLLLAPSIIFLVSWATYSQRKTGDALVFLSAKSAWLERTVVDFVVHPTERPANILHMVVFVAVLILASRRLREVPRYWLSTCFVFLAPSLVLGIEGLARYVSLAIPVSILVGASISRWTLGSRLTFLAVSGGAMLFLAVNVVRSAWVP